MATEGFTLPVEFLGPHVAATLRRGFETFGDVADGFLDQPIGSTLPDLLGQQIVALAIVQLGRLDQDAEGSGERLNALLVVHVRVYRAWLEMQTDYSLLQQEHKSCLGLLNDRSPQFLLAGKI